MNPKRRITIHSILAYPGIHYVAIHRPTPGPAAPSDAYRDGILAGSGLAPEPVSAASQWEAVSDGDHSPFDQVAERLRITLDTLGVPMIRLTTDAGVRAHDLGVSIAICCERIDDYIVVVAMTNGHPVVKSMRRMVRHLVKHEQAFGPGPAPTPTFAPGSGRPVSPVALAQ